MPLNPTQSKSELYFENRRSHLISSFTRGKMNGPERLLIAQGHSAHVQHLLRLLTKTY